MRALEVSGPPRRASGSWVPRVPCCSYLAPPVSAGRSDRGDDGDGVSSSCGDRSRRRSLCVKLSISRRRALAASAPVALTSSVPAEERERARSGSLSGAAQHRALPCCPHSRHVARWLVGVGRSALEAPVGACAAACSTSRAVAARCRVGCEPWYPLVRTARLRAPHSQSFNARCRVPPSPVYCGRQNGPHLSLAHGPHTPPCQRASDGYLAERAPFRAVTWRHNCLPLLRWQGEAWAEDDEFVRRRRRRNAPRRTGAELKPLKPDERTQHPASSRP
jgi:hypothetical protein